MNLSNFRKDFPILSSDSIVYLDTACQSLRPRQVIEKITDYYENFPACSGRSMHKLAATVTQKIDEARTQIAKFLGASKKEEVIFTRNATEGINLVANSMDFQPGDVILVTGKEHNSNLIPWQILAKKQNIQLKIQQPKEDGTFDLLTFEQEMKSPVKLVSFGYSSNLDGLTIPAEKIIKFAHQHGALVLLDAAQTVPHHKISVKSLDVDFLVLSGHKMLGPSGTGVLFGKLKLLEQLNPFMVGGDTVANSTYHDCEFLPVPEKFEAGLQDYAGIIGLGEAAKYLQMVGFDTIEEQENMLNQAIDNGLWGIEGLHIIGPKDPVLRSGMTTFYIEGIDSHRIALMLDQMANVMVRSGQHCVHSWFNHHNVKGSVRASTYFYNTLEEVDIFVSNLKKIRKVL